MNKKELDLLLSKYYRGETSLDEEQQLRQAMLEGDDADALLQQALDKVDSEIEVPGDLESSLSDMIDQWDSAEQHEAAVAPSMWRRNPWWAAAASVAIIAAVGFWFMRNTSQPVAEQEHPVIAQVEKEPVPSQPAATQPLPVEPHPPPPRARIRQARKHCSRPKKNCWRWLRSRSSHLPSTRAWTSSTTLARKLKISTTLLSNYYNNRL